MDVVEPNRIGHRWRPHLRGGADPPQARGRDVEAGVVAVDISRERRAQPRRTRAPARRNSHHRHPPRRPRRPVEAREALLPTRRREAKCAANRPVPRAVKRATKPLMKLAIATRAPRGGRPPHHRAVISHHAPPAIKAVAAPRKRVPPSAQPLPAPPQRPWASLLRTPAAASAATRPAACPGARRPVCEARKSSKLYAVAEIAHANRAATPRTPCIHGLPPTTAD
eukprot:1398840-Pleurochrysis_carterae.AAC.1